MPTAQTLTERTMPRFRVERLRDECLEQLREARRLGLKEWAEAFQKRLYALEMRLAKDERRRGP